MASEYPAWLKAIVDGAYQEYGAEGVLRVLHMYPQRTPTWQYDGDVGRGAVRWGQWEGHVEHPLLTQRRRAAFQALRELSTELGEED